MLTQLPGTLPDLPCHLAFQSRRPLCYPRGLAQCWSAARSRLVPTLASMGRRAVVSTSEFSVGARAFQAALEKAGYRVDVTTLEQAAQCSTADLYVDRSLPRMTYRCHPGVGHGGTVRTGRGTPGRKRTQRWWLLRKVCLIRARSRSRLWAPRRGMRPQRTYLSVSGLSRPWISWAV